MSPKSVWENIKQFIPENKTIYDPFYGNGQSGIDLASVLPNNKIIHESVDFFIYKDIYKYDIIVSNPSFSNYKEILKALVVINKPFIVVLPSSKINTQTFRNIFKDSQDNLQIIIPRKRIHFKKIVNGIEPENWKNGCNFDCFYYCYKLNLQKDITWLE
jgi:hypothetical protein